MATVNHPSGIPMTLSNWNILPKIMLVIFALAVASLSAAGFAAYKMKAIDGTYNRLLGNDTRALTLMIHDDDVTNDLGQNLWHAIAASDLATLKALQTAFDKEAAAELAELDQGIRTLPEYKEKLQKLRELTQQNIDQAKPAIAAALAQDNKAALKAMDAFATSNAAIADFVGKAIDEQAKYLNNASDAATAETWRTIYTALGATFGGIFVVTLGSIFLTRSGITGPIREIVESLKDLAHGKLNISVSGTERLDEIGDIAKAAQVFKDNLIEAERMRGQQKLEQDKQIDRARKMEVAVSNFDKMVGEVIESVSAASTELQSTAQSLSATAQETTRQSHGVASASDQMTQNVQTVAAATEELSASIQEIGNQVTTSARIASEAVSQAEETNGKVRALSEAAQKIGRVVTIINDIASQTNLLALNATIEAAREGEAGKGFAVVASEVKNLAGQTAKATDEITLQIQDIQASTDSSVQSIQAITETIAKVNQIATAIAAGVEQQGMATQEIARNVQQAATGTNEVSSNIAGVTEASQTTSAGSTQVLSSANELAKNGARLKCDVSAFLAEVRSL
jgi:methyl-accepting chemotaxis protein